MNFITHLKYYFLTIIMIILLPLAYADTSELNSLILKGYQAGQESPVSSPEQAIKRYFEKEVFPRVPQAIYDLKSSPTCPGACCPPTHSATGKNDPALHAAQIAFKLVGKNYCTKTSEK